MPVVIRKIDAPDPPLTIAEGARLLGVSSDTLRRYARQRVVEAFRLPGRRGHFRIERAALERFRVEGKA